MKRSFNLFILGLGFLKLNAQCDILNRVYPDQTMYYYMEPVLFYYTEQNELKGDITTDKDTYFLQLFPRPFPKKGEDKKLNNPLEIELSNKQVYSLENYDTRYRRSDTTLVLMYIIPKKSLDDFINFDVLDVKIDLGDEKGPRNYIFKLHTGALREQLICLRKKK